MDTHLMDGPEEGLFLGWQEALTSAGFNHKDRQGDERLVVDPDGRPLSVSYTVNTYGTADGDRVVYFYLRSEISHVSSIAACFGIPREAARFPLFVMNLNLKPRLKAFNIVLGYRGYTRALQHSSIRVPSIPGSGVRPLIVHNSPDGFAGVRATFEADSAVVEWAFSSARDSGAMWMGGLRDANLKTFEGDVDNCNGPYRDFMLKLHDMPDNVFDKVFGDGWVKELFQSTCVKPPGR